ncbi:nucleotide disphospho-sugar-binding domain-containing protein [Catellatospora coxensis]
MSRVAFLNVGMHGHVNPTLPLVTELVRRGHSVTYHTTPAFAEQIAAAGAGVPLLGRRAATGRSADGGHPDGAAGAYGGAGAAGCAHRSALHPARSDRARLRLPVGPGGGPGTRRARRVVVHHVRLQPARAQPHARVLGLLGAALAMPRSAWGYLRARRELRRRYDMRGVPRIDLADIRQPLNLVYTSPAFHPDAAGFDESFRFVGPSIGSRPADASFPSGELRDPVLYVSMGTVFDAGPQQLRAFVDALGPLGGTVVVATGHTDPAELGPLPANVLARRAVPQLEVLARAALFVTHGGVNSVNEALHAGVPMLVIPQGADQTLVARRIVELGAGLETRTETADVETVRALGRRLLGEPRFRAAGAALQAAQRHASGASRAADELEGYLRQTGAAERSAAEPRRKADR